MLQKISPNRKIFFISDTMLQKVYLKEIEKIFRNEGLRFFLMFLRPEKNKKT
jgi:3-dehydroquinate synthetase